MTDLLQWAIALTVVNSSPVSSATRWRRHARREGTGQERLTAVRTGTVVQATPSSIRATLSGATPWRTRLEFLLAQGNGQTLGVLRDA